MNKISNKSWGREEIIVHTNKYIMKKLFIEAGQQSSKQFHVEKDETVYVSKGLLLLDLSCREGESNIIKLAEGESWRITPRTVHRFTAPEDQAVEFFEISTPEVDDVVYLEGSRDNA